MSSSDFRQITVKSRTDRADRLFRAAVSAFCSLTRPSRGEIVQLEDLTLPLFDQVSPESKRYVAGALAECAAPPAALVKRLADESVDIAGPLLVRSPVLGDADLVALIARHGWPHARAIGRRADLNPAIANLVALLERKVVPFRPRDTQSGMSAPERREDTGPHAPDTPTEETLRRLRAMMLPGDGFAMPPSASVDGETTGRIYGRTAYDRLRATVLTGHRDLFQTALANALSKDFASVRQASDTSSYGWLLDAMRLLALDDEKAFLVTAALYPSLFGDLDSIRRFLLRYAAVSQTEARRRIAGWSPTRPPAGSYQVAG